MPCSRAIRLAAGCVLLSPHAMYYDAGLTALPLLLAVVHGTPLQRRVAVGLWAVALLHPFAHVGVTPVFVTLVGSFLLAVRIHVDAAGPAVAARAAGA